MNFPSSIRGWCCGKRVKPKGASASERRHAWVGWWSVVASPVVGGLRRLSNEDDGVTVGGVTLAFNSESNNVGKLWAARRWNENPQGLPMVLRGS